MELRISGSYPYTLPFPALWWQNGDHQTAKGKEAGAGGVWPCILTNSVSAPRIWRVCGTHRFTPGETWWLRPLSAWLLCGLISEFRVTLASPQAFFLGSENINNVCSIWGAIPVRRLKSITFNGLKAFSLTKLLRQMKLVHPWNLSLSFSPHFRPTGASKLKPLPVTFGLGKSENWSNNN